MIFTSSTQSLIPDSIHSSSVQYMSKKDWVPYYPRRACTAGCYCIWCVCASVCVSTFISSLWAKKQMVSVTNGFSVTSVQKIKWWFPELLHFSSSNWQCCWLSYLAQPINLHCAFVFKHLQCCLCTSAFRREIWHKSQAIATSSLPVQCIVEYCSWRQVADLALPKLSIQMQLACVAARPDRGIQQHHEAWPIIVHCWFDMWYALRALHFSAFHY